MSKDQARARRNLVLFLAHLGLAAFFVAWFVWTVVNK